MKSKCLLLGEKYVTIFLLEESNAIRSNNKRIKNINKKERRRLRAQLNENRSKTLGPLQIKIADKEKIIMLLEKDVEKESHALVDASERGDGKAISMLSISIHKLNSQIETAFAELELLTNKYEEKTGEFEKKLMELRKGAELPTDYHLKTL